MPSPRSSGPRPRSSRRPLDTLGSLLLILLLSAPLPMLAADPESPSTLPGPLPQDGRGYPVSEFVITYLDPNPQFPTPFDMSQLEVELAESADGFVGPRVGLPTTRFRLIEVSSMEGAPIFYASALRAVNQQLVFEFNRRDFYAIVVSPLEEDIERRTGRDLRPAGETALRLGIYAGRVKDLRTFASGDDYDDDDEKLDRPEHAWIREDSPIQPDGEQDLVRKRLLDDYLARLNRHLTRRVDAEISPARTEGGVNLDYMVAENKPWWAYAQFDNTGTEETTDLRERFGFVHADLTHHDDVAHLEYFTGDFEEVQAVIGSYEIPFSRGGPLRARVFADWSRYDASVLGFDRSFTGEQTDAGAQLIGNVFQWKELFVDAVVGGQYQRITVKNDLANTDETQNFALGMVGLRAERLGLTSSLRSELSFIYNFQGIANTDRSDLVFLGRFGVDDASFSVLRWNLNFSFFIEPLLEPRTWSDPSVLTTRSLANELWAEFRGQNSLNHRLIPQQEQIAGGMYSVRGYQEAAVVGDNVEIGRFEYRLHIPRLFSPNPKPIRLPVVGDFRAQPMYDYTFPDWDLIFRGFFDIGHVSHTDANAFEETQTLMGAGAGLELHLMRYITARIDYGFALKEVDLTSTDKVKSGDDELNFSVTILY